MPPADNAPESPDTLPSASPSKAPPPAPPATPSTGEAPGLGDGPWPASWKALCWAGLVALYLFLSLYRLNDLALINPDEPRYATAGRTMSEGGSWMIPEYNGEPRINKPPLFYWLVAVSNLALGGSNEFSSRLPSVAMGLAMLLLTVWLGQRLYGPATGFLAGLMLIPAPLFFAVSRSCVTDQTFSTLLAGALACILLGLAGKFPLRGMSVLALGLCAGLAFMAKGTATLIVFVVPFLFVLLFAFKLFWWQPGGRHWVGIWLMVAAVGLVHGLVRKFTSAASDFENTFLGPYPAYLPTALVLAALSVVYYGLQPYWRPRWWYVALVLFLALGGWWYGLLIYEMGYPRFKALVDFEVGGRLSGRMHAQGPLYYLYLFHGVFFPWSIGLVAAVVAAWRKQTRRLPLEENAPAADVAHTADAFMVAWLLGVVIFFTIPKAKLPTYVLPAFPAAALLTARLALRLQGAGEAVPRAAKLAVLAVALLLSELLLFAGLHPYEEPKGLAGDQPWSKPALAAVLGLFALQIAGAVLGAIHLLRWHETSRLERARFPIKAAAIVMAAPLLAGAAAIPTRLVEFPNRWQMVIDELPLPLWCVAAVFFAGTALPWIAACLTRQGVKTIVAQAVLLVGLLSFVLATRVDEFSADHSNRDLCLELEPYLAKAKRVSTAGCREESLPYYLRRKIHEMRKRDVDRNEPIAAVLKDELAMDEKGTVLVFVHNKLFRRFLEDRPPPGSSIAARTGHLVVLVNDPDAGSKDAAAAEPSQGDDGEDDSKDE
ncbi:MAG: glycosyltransferase family 39 protein [Planctomycetes bacterium]|nr:glycosyltransferase family 39 protein [Planctomycetota bacterium]